MSDYETDKYIKHLESQIEKLQGEIESLSQSNLSLKQLAKDVAEKSNKEIERLKEEHRIEWENGILFNKQIAELTAKHERLVKRLKDTQNIPMSLNSGYVRWDVINTILTEEGNV